MVERPGAAEPTGGGMLNWAGRARVSVVVCVAVTVLGRAPGAGAGAGGAGVLSSLVPVGAAMAVGGSARAPGWGAGGAEGSVVVVAGMEAGVVRVGTGFAV